VREVFSSKVEFHKKSRLLLTTLTTYFTDKTGVMSLTPSIVQLHNLIVDLGIKNWSQCLRGPGGGNRFVCLEILVLQRGCSSKGQIWAVSLRMLWQLHII